MRVRLKIPDSFHFETTLSVRVSDLNYGGHLGNDSFYPLLMKEELDTSIN